jgi:hypothetical protein
MGYGHPSRALSCPLRSAGSDHAGRDPGGRRVGSVCTVRGGRPIRDRLRSQGSEPALISVPRNYTLAMFERFTDRARRVVVLAQEEVTMLNHDHIGTEHILLGLIKDGEGVAAKALDSLGFSLDLVRSQVEEIIGQGQATPTGHIPFTPRAKKVLELSLREAVQLKHDYIGTEHILLGLIREGKGVAVQVLQTLGADLNRLRQQVINLVPVGSAEGDSLDPAIGEFRAKLAHVMVDKHAAQRHKDAALDEGDAQSAIRFRAEERRLLEDLLERTAPLEPRWRAFVEESDRRLQGVRREKHVAIDQPDFDGAQAFKDEGDSLDVVIGELDAIDANLDRVIVDKDAALDEGDTQSAIRFRAEQLRLVEDLNEQRAALGRKWRTLVGEFDRRIEEAKRRKEAAIDQADFESAQAFKDEEKWLLDKKWSIERWTGRAGR